MQQEWPIFHFHKSFMKFKVEDVTKHLNKIMQPTHERVEIARDKYNNMWVEVAKVGQYV